MKPRTTPQVLWYLVIATICTMFGLSYAAVPIYRLFCSATGYGGSSHLTSLVLTTKQEPQPTLTIQFEAATQLDLPWQVQPMQRQLDVCLGQPAIAFYKATNTSSDSITGVATYSVLPPEAGFYFNKLQCFCFEEQTLHPHESVELPLLFFIDPSIALDTKLSAIKNITIAYTFFSSIESDHVTLTV